MIKQIILITITAVMALIVACGPIAKEKVDTTIDDFGIFREEPIETGYSAKITTYAFLKTDTITEERLIMTLNKIYDRLEKYDKFTNFSKPTAITIYMYESSESARKYPELWLAMLRKSQKDSMPIFSFDKTRMSVYDKSNDPTDDVKTEIVKAIEDSIQLENLKYEKITNYFIKRGITICFIYKKLYDLQGESIKKADVMFPDFGTSHSLYQEQIYKEERSKIFKKYNINDTLVDYIASYGYKNCR